MKARNNIKTITRKAIAAAVTAGLLMSSTVQAEELSADGTTSYDAPVSLSLNFSFHTEMDMAEQDVFIEREAGSDEIWRVTKADQDWNAPLYRAARPIEHNPFDGNAVGPYQKGESLDMTLGQWFAAEGKGSYTCENGKGHIDVNFTSLAPNGVYTMWHAFMAMPPTTPFIGTFDLPMGARDGSQSVFNSDAAGSARFQRDFTPCLQMSGEHLAGMLAVNWHIDANTYGVLPGEFAENAHIQLFTLLPKRTGL
jgi:hypothetical protein